MFAILKKFTQWIMPHSCLFCRNITDQPRDICEYCLRRLPILQQSCPICANILSEAFICGQCLKNKPPFDETHSLFNYQAPIIKLILDLKFHHQFANAKLLGELLAENIIKRNNPLPSIIIPMPLHIDRLRERGFNQALEIARPITQHLNIPLSLHDVIRSKPTLAQSTLSATQRIKNIRHAFQVLKDFSGQHVAVLDDVITTGSTINEICQQLKENGAKKISVWCCAKVLLA